MASTSTNKQPMMLDRPASTSTLVRTQTGQLFSTSLLPTSIGNVTKIFDVDQALTDTQISGAYIDEIFIRYTKDVNRVIDSVTATAATYTRAAAVLTITLANHNFKVGQKLFFDVQSGGAPTEEVTVTEVTDADTIKANSSTSGTITTSNVNIQKPIDFCFYLVNSGTIDNIEQFFPLFVQSIPCVPENQTVSLTMQEVLPLINHPTVQAGANFVSANNEVAPKQRGLMLKRGQALYVAASGTNALTHGFYCNIQGGFY